MKFPKTSGFKRRQELVRQIIEAYKQKAIKLAYQLGDLRDIRSDYRESVANYRPTEILSNPPLQDVFGHYDQKTQQRIGTGLIQAILFAPDEAMAEAEWYEKLVDSPRLYFVTGSDLQEVLERLPLTKKPKSFTYLRNQRPPTV
ncbi:MAG: hypothetical protein HYW24_00080 [Candidatus Aenigmarchaeota archaeon]|nr:hypothetical protein [Candidatus Aenigmarchaeota archaeon]